MLAQASFWIRPGSSARARTRSPRGDVQLWYVASSLQLFLGGGAKSRCGTTSHAVAVPVPDVACDSRGGHLNPLAPLHVPFSRPITVQPPLRGSPCPKMPPQPVPPDVGRDTGLREPTAASYHGVRSMYIGSSPRADRLPIGVGLGKSGKGKIANG